MRLLFLFFFITVNLFSQEKDKNYQLSIGAKIELTRYKILKTDYSGKENTYYSYFNHGYGSYIQINTFFQNRFIYSSLDNGFNTSALTVKSTYQLQLKQAFNINFKDKSLDFFWGPFVSYGFLFYKHHATKPVTSVGLLIVKNHYQFEIGRVFRKQYVNHNVFVNGYFISFGYSIPINKQAKN